MINKTFILFRETVLTYYVDQVDVLLLLIWKHQMYGLICLLNWQEGIIQEVSVKELKMELLVQL